MTTNILFLLALGLPVAAMLCGIGVFIEGIVESGKARKRAEEYRAEDARRHAAWKLKQRARGLRSWEFGER